MKINYLCLLFLLLFSFVIVSCNDDDDEFLGNWSELYDLDGPSRSDAVSFVINGKAYLGTGYDGEDPLSDFWEYNPEKNSWTQMADIPVARNAAVGFSIGTKGYVGTGYDEDQDADMKDFYEFDPEANTWTQIADFPGISRYGAVSFTIGTNGYVGCGYDRDDKNNLKDFYYYSQTDSTWTKIVSIGGSKRRDAQAFAINGKGYVVSGLDNGSYLGDMWEYDPDTEEWTEKRKITDYTDYDYDDDYTTIARINGVTFNINGKVYLACGSKSSIVNNVWEYDPTNDLWEEKTAFEGSSRTEAVGFAIDSKGYVATGKSSSQYFDDIWSFDPSAEYDENY